MSSLQLMEILSGLHSRFGGDLLPNIRCITADTIWPHKYPFITSIISPHLRSISLNDCDGLQCDAILGLLERQSPSLEELVIGDRDDPIEFTAFDSLKNLSSLKIIGPLTRGALQSILHCAELQKLSLTYFNIYVLRDSQSDREAINPLSTSPLITLPKLRMIELGLVDYVGDDLLEECMVWDVVSCPLLKEVVIFRSGKQDARWIRRIAQESPQVTQIKFVAGLLLDFEVLQQLPTFRDLVEIRILDDSRSPGMDIFPYDRIEDFLFLIPRLEVFEWRPSKNHRGWSLVLWTDVVDLESLPTITSKCSRLHRLCLPLNMRETAPKLKRMSQDIDVEDLVEPCASLKSLEMVVFSLYDEDVEDLARVMVHLVPYSADLTISVAPRLYLEQGRRMLDVRYGHRELEVKLASMVEEFRAQKRRHLI
ncbi:hypothetical protein FRC03_011766 [Tulasnella sp. 419]|nr:hypothetical protein FRC03_011766 [Tulasnella sp. 419]